MSVPPLTLSLLSVPVRIECEDPRAAELLAACYEWSRVPCDPSPLLVSARLEGVEHLFRIEVEGRAARELDGRDEALRAFHHELLHAVMLQRTDLLYVHAAVVAIEGRAVVLPGLSQSGKSTLALALVMRGAQFLSDELLAFDPRSNTCIAYPRALKIRDVCVPYFPTLADRFVGAGEARYLPFAALRQSPVASNARVALIAVPRWSGSAAPEWEELPRRRAVLELASSTLNFGMHRSSSIDYLGALVERSATYRILWRNPHEAAERIAHALSEAARG